MEIGNELNYLYWIYSAIHS